MELRAKVRAPRTDEPYGPEPVADGGLLFLAPAFLGQPH